MSVYPTLETEGLEVVARVLDALASLGSKIGAVELNSIEREGIGPTNAELLRFLAGLDRDGKIRDGAQKRDFITPSEEDLEDISEAFANEIERRVSNEFSEDVGYGVKDRMILLNEWFKSGFGKKLSSFASQMAGAALKKAMLKYMEQVTDRIDYGRTNNPPFDRRLSEQYEKWKKNVYGFAYPIGKATGQLIDNLNPDGLGSRNIRLKKS
jgi:hypothetical protein